MTPAMRILALKAHRLTLKKITGKELAKRLKLVDGVYFAIDQASMHAIRGCMIVHAESLQLTEREWLVMKTLARLEARRVALVSNFLITTANVDRAARRSTGWCNDVIEKRLRKCGLGEEHDPNRLGFVEIDGHTPRHIWLTRAGWTLVWEAKLIKPNWKVPS